MTQEDRHFKLRFRDLDVLVSRAVACVAEKRSDHHGSTPTPINLLNPVVSQKSITALFMLLFGSNS